MTPFIVGSNPTATTFCYKIEWSFYMEYVEEKKRGRPKGSKNKTSSKLKKMLDKPQEFLEEYRCTMCGTVYKDSNNFLSARGNVIYQANGNKISICRKCSNALFEELTNRYRDEKVVFMIMCYYLGYYFDEVMYERLRNRNNFSFSLYCQSLSLIQNKNKDFVNSILEIMQNRLKEDDEIREETEKNWSENEKNAKYFCIENVGYDCFEDKTYSGQDRKLLFLFLANNLTDEILEDNKKINAVIELAKTQMQITKMNELLNEELRNSNTLDYGKTEKLVNIKNKLSSTYNDIANENGLSQKGLGVKVRKSNSLTAIMKEMHENGFEDIKVNYTDAKLSSSYKEIAEINARALMNELNLSADDYALMLSRQSEKLKSLQENYDAMEEENRKLKIKMKKLQEK